MAHRVKPAAAGIPAGAEQVAGAAAGAPRPGGPPLPADAGTLGVENQIPGSTYPTHLALSSVGGGSAGVAQIGCILVAKEDKVEFEGEVIEALPNAMFRVKLDNDHVVLGHVAGQMRRFRIRILPGDRVRCELSPYDLDRARIVYRHR